jgi:hypothetical protein
VSLRQEGTAEFWEREQAVGREKRGAESRRERAGAGGREREQAGSGSRRERAGAGGPPALREYARQDSNLQPLVPKTSALSIELRALVRRNQITSQRSG